MIRILLLVDCANDFDRNLLRGIVRYSRENGPWLFYRLPSYYRSIENGYFREPPYCIFCL